MKLLHICTLLAGLTLSAQCLALADDREQPIHIQSDSAIVDDKNGISTYLGRVTVQQGSLRIVAARVEVHASANVVTKIIASASEDPDDLAHYEQLPDNKPLVEANAKTIVYFVSDERLELTGNASLTQTQDRSFSGETINYDARLGRVNAESKGDERVKATFTPQQN